MKIGDPDGHGQYGVVDENTDGLLCHECGHRFTHLGLHVWRRHELTAADFRQAHGLSKVRGLVASETRSVIIANAQRTFSSKAQFVASRDPALATAARLEQGAGMSPAGLAASRTRRAQGRRGTVVVCEWCKAEFCPLTSASRRRFCTKSHASLATAARSSRKQP